MPSILIYRLFPDTQVAASGPLAGLTVRTSGAFAGYLIIFLLVLPLTQKLVGSTQALLTPVWTVTGTVVALGYDHKPDTRDWYHDNISIKLSRPPHEVAGNNIKLRIPFDKDNWPAVVLNIPDFGGVSVKLIEEYGDSMDIDEYTKTATIHAPLTISRFQPRHYSAAGLIGDSDD